nr:MAG TPA: hypothetical protein [Caudoviricetes sp.]
MDNHIFEIESRIDQIAERLCKNFNYLPWVEKEELNNLVAKAKWDISSYKIYKTPISYQQMVISTLALINSYSRLLKQANVEYLI